SSRLERPVQRAAAPFHAPLSLSGLLRRSYPARRKCLAGTAGLARLPPARQQRLAKPFSLQFFIDEKVMADADQLEPLTSRKAASRAITAPARDGHRERLIDENRPWGDQILRLAAWRHQACLRSFTARSVYISPVIAESVCQEFKKEFLAHQTPSFNRLSLVGTIKSASTDAKSFCFFAFVRFVPVYLFEFIPYSLAHCCGVGWSPEGCRDLVLEPQLSRIFAEPRPTPAPALYQHRNTSQKYLKFPSQPIWASWSVG